jgi:hypothetical protein
VTEQTAVDFDGCNRKCRQAGAHTLVWGECEHAPEPEPTVSLSRVYKAADGFPAIGFDTYTLPELARLIEGAVGDPLRAAAAARAIVHRNDPDDTDLTEADIDRMLAAGTPVQIVTEPPATFAAPAVPAGQAPAADRGGLRQQIAKALVRYDWNAGLSGRDTPSEHHYGEADAVLAVLPAPADRAAVLREAADELGRMDYDTDSNDYGYDTYRDAWNGGVMDGAEELRRMADEAGPADTTKQDGGEMLPPVTEYRIEALIADTWTTLGAPLDLDLARRIRADYLKGWPEARTRVLRCTRTAVVIDAEQPAARAQQPEEAQPVCNCGYIAEPWIKMDHAQDCPARPVTPMDPVNILGIGSDEERPS